MGEGRMIVVGLVPMVGELKSCPGGIVGGLIKVGWFGAGFP